jgi:hypothetical protein
MTRSQPNEPPIWIEHSSLNTINRCEDGMLAWARLSCCTVPSENPSFLFLLIFVFHRLDFRSLLSIRRYRL